LTPCPLPAPAGNTRCRSSICSAHTVHPRACGEHLFQKEPAFCLLGSSPRLRGTLLRKEGGQVEIRFIPAPAGNTLHRGDSLSAFTVHPRACGEHFVDADRADVEDGSSPRLRGTHCYSDPLLAVLRFIPAPAGNTAHTVRGPSTTPVHPRACGEHF